MIASDGWSATVDGKNNVDLIPPALIVARYFAAEQTTIEQREAAAGKAVKDAQKVLDTQVATQYAKLTEAEIKTLVVEDKWLHLLERHHNERFAVLLETHLPQWRQYREMLKKTPLGHENWSY